MTYLQSIADVMLWSNNGDMAFLAQGQLNCIRALAGYTDASSPDTALDTATFCEREYLQQIVARSGNLPVVMNWYNSFKVVALFCIGFAQAAAELGFEVYATRDKHPK